MTLQKRGKGKHMEGKRLGIMTCLEEFGYPLWTAPELLVEKKGLIIAYAQYLSP
jgi:hypothetical protein